MKSIWGDSIPSLLFYCQGATIAIILAIWEFLVMPKLVVNLLVC